MAHPRSLSWSAMEPGLLTPGDDWSLEMALATLCTPALGDSKCLLSAPETHASPDALLTLQKMATEMVSGPSRIGAGPDGLHLTHKWAPLLRAPHAAGFL